MEHEPDSYSFLASFQVPVIEWYDHYWMEQEKSVLTDVAWIYGTNPRVPGQSTEQRWILLIWIWLPPDKEEEEETSLGLGSIERYREGQSKLSGNSREALARLGPMGK